MNICADAFEDMPAIRTNAATIAVYVRMNGIQILSWFVYSLPHHAYRPT
jgi:hypothetical protein